jgi:hypothetical protein
MKLGDDVLLCIMEALRKGLTESVDISELLREIDLVEDGSGKLKLSAPLKDVWTVSGAV